MNRGALPALCLGFLLVASGHAIDLRQRTDSGQFTIYCEDIGLRRQVASLAMRTRDDLQSLLQDEEGKRRPILVTIEVASELAIQPAPVLRLVESEVGLKIEIAVRIGNDPAKVNLQQQFVRALLLEFMYRRSGVTGGTAYVEPPWWLLAGLVELLRSREAATNSDFYRKLLETNRLPQIESFLVQKPDQLGPAAYAVDDALSMALVQLLVEQPGGRQHLAALLRAWPVQGNDPVAALSREFPALAGGAPALQKWWTLNLARFAAADRFQGMSAKDTVNSLAPLLEFDIELPTAQGAHHFTIGEFAQYLKLPASRRVLADRRMSLVALSARANVLWRPVLGEYVEILGLLARGKISGIAARLEQNDRLRAAIVKRTEEIMDYLNWYEATQMKTRSDLFDNYLKTANQMADEAKRERSQVSSYLDELERAY